MILASHGIIGSQITQFVGLLDTYSGAAAAYSLRKLRSAYTGSSIKVRRASDNTEQDIGFVNNELDTTSLASFCSGTNGFVTTWYDQSGNGNDATQTTASDQPQIVSSGSVILDNGKPSIQFDNTNDFLNTSTFTSLSNASYFMVSHLNIGSGSGDYSYIFSTANSGFPIQSLAKRHNDGADANTRYIFDGLSSHIDGVNTLNQELASLFFPTSSPYLNLYINNSVQSFVSTPSSAVEPSNKSINIGRYSAGTTHYLDLSLIHI